LSPSIDRANRSSGKWAEHEDSKLKYAVHKHGDRDWYAIAARVPGRTQEQCGRRWRDVLKASIAVTTGREGKWAEEEVTKLKDAIQTYGDKNWKEVVALVPGRTENSIGIDEINACTPICSTVRAGKITQDSQESACFGAG
jgi:hypothetical protein